MTTTQYPILRHKRAIHAALLAWYRSERRALPWRRDRDPYRVWVAEVMLQQTRIKVVEPAYRRFMQAFPTLGRLAAADEEKVLSLWSGLGYYGRARTLRRAARLLQGRGESFPRNYDAARELPGVGAYTAAAVLSIAYDEPYAAVDGNVARVLSRLARLPSARNGAPQRTLATAVLNRQQPGDWNQAIMELGETICLPKSPRCNSCPLASRCEAHIHAEVDRYPPPRPRRQVERVALRLDVVRDRKGRLLLDRGTFPHLKHLWLPLISVPGATATSRRAMRVSNDLKTQQRHTFRHAILHRQFDVAVTAYRVAGADLRRLLRAPSGAERRLFSEAELRAIGRSSLLSKALAHERSQHS